MKLILRSGGLVETRDPFRRSPSGFQAQTLSKSEQDRFKMKELMTLGAVARSFWKVGRGSHTADQD